MLVFGYLHLTHDPFEPHGIQMNSVSSSILIKYIIYIKICKSSLSGLIFPDINKTFYIIYVRHNYTVTE